MVARLPSCEPCVSNTGLNSQTGFSVGVDWLDITYRNIPTLQVVEDVLSEVEALLSDEIDFSPTRATFNGRAWSGSGRGLKGTLIFYDAGSTDGDCEARAPELKICMSGSVIAGAEQKAIAYWLNGRAEQNALDCTRIDIALDDHEKFIKMETITQAFRAENFFNASETEYEDSGKRRQDRGITLYFGSKKSDKRLCIYDKTIESAKRILGNRWEGRFRRIAARVAMFQWIQANLKDENTVERWCTNVVTGLIDFRDRSGDDPNRLRCKVLDWYQQLCDRLRAVPARIRKPIVAMTMQRSIDWIVKSVAPSIFSLKSVLGDDFSPFFQSLLTQGADRLSNPRRKLIHTTERGQLYYET
jgi:hypothetical protein